MKFKQLIYEYEQSYLKLRSKIKALKKELNSFYDKGDYTNTNIYYLRKEIVILEEMMYDVKAIYLHLKNYYNERGDKN